MWTEEKVEELKTRWASGLTADQIASELGPEFTRGAVAGKIHRLKLPLRPKKSTKVRLVVNNSDAFRLDESYSNKKTLLELEPHSCRWPVGDPLQDGFFFCGSNRLHRLTSYCGYHEKFSRPPECTSA